VSADKAIDGSAVKLPRSSQVAIVLCLALFAVDGGNEDLSTKARSGKRWLKAELHSHCSLDPIDYRVCEHTPEELILNAAKLGYDILAITCHNLDVWTEELADYARSLGITLIPGMEVATERTRHTLVYNFQTEAGELDTLKKIRALSREDTLVIAAHPYFPGHICLRDLVEKNPDVFDAIECSGFHTLGINFNRRSEVMAARMKKPLVGNGDVHFLWQLNRTFTWIYAEPGVLPILRAVKKGMVRVQQSPLKLSEAAQWWATCLRRYAFPVNPAPYAPRKGFPAWPSDKIKDRRCFGPTQEGVES
jgi:predicted metal-dependent phosphoesterase TrpH